MSRASPPALTKHSQYRTVYFHESGAEVDRKFKHYIDGFVSSTRAFTQKHKVFTVLAATERLDAVACRAIAEEIPGLPIFTSDDYDMYQLVSILRQAAYMVSSRYHGIVTCMPSLVASAGVTMDERIRNLMRERGHQHLCAAVDDPDLGPQNVANDGIARRRTRIHPRRHRPDRRPQSQSHGSHGRNL